MLGEQKPRRQLLKSAPCKDKSKVSDAASQKVTVSELGVPLRKRTERACDQCRRRKTKCDGAHDCKACLEVGLDCSYGNQKKQVRGPSYVAHLERRVKQLESEDEQRKALDSSKRGNDRCKSKQQGALLYPQIRSDNILLSCDSSTDDSQTDKSQFAGSNAIDLKRDARDSELEVLPPRDRSASQVLSEAKVILDNLSSTNPSARCAARCLESINQDMYQTQPLPQPVDDFVLFGSNSLVPDSNVYFGPLDTESLNLDPAADALSEQKPVLADLDATTYFQQAGYLYFPTTDTIR